MPQKRCTSNVCGERQFAVTKRFAVFALFPGLISRFEQLTIARNCLRKVHNLNPDLNL
jgi:hypothetical protein